MRKIPNCPARPAIRRRPGWVRKELRLETITPMLGAGTKPLHLDRQSYVRGGTIRGLLRYWWRACQFDVDFTELIQRETELFGAASTPGRLSITLGEIEAKRIRNGTRFPNYVRFPFMGPGGADIQSQSIMVTFTLRLEYPAEYEPQLDNALWAWANFGGIGMRTRRGAGALLVREYAPADCDALDERLRTLCGNHHQRERSWSVLSSRLRCGPKATDAMAAWGAALEKLSRFRQIPIGRPRMLSRSRWPEADSIRRITRRAAARHRESITGSNNAFPRAELGLPLIIRFKDRGEPGPVTLVPVEGGRRPSPVILRPLQLQDGSVVPMALIMNTPPLKGVRLDPLGKSYGGKHLRGHGVRGYLDSPLDRYGKDNAVDAFEEMLGREWNR